MSEVPLYSSSHSMDYDGFVASNSGGLRDQIYATYGPEDNCVRQLDF